MAEPNERDKEIACAATHPVSKKVGLCVKADLTLTERHARVGRLLDKMQAACLLAPPAPWIVNAAGVVWPGSAAHSRVAEVKLPEAEQFIARSRVWLPALLAFARAEWERAGKITPADAGYILTRLESALASLLEVDRG